MDFHFLYLDQHTIIDRCCEFIRGAPPLSMGAQLPFSIHFSWKQLLFAKFSAMENYVRRMCHIGSIFGVVVSPPVLGSLLPPKFICFHPLGPPTLKNANHPIRYRSTRYIDMYRIYRCIDPMRPAYLWRWLIKSSLNAVFLVSDFSAQFIVSLTTH